MKTIEGIRDEIKIPSSRAKECAEEECGGSYVRTDIILSIRISTLQWVLIDKIIKTEKEIEDKIMYLCHSNPECLTKP